MLAAYSMPAAFRRLSCVRAWAAVYPLFISSRAGSYPLSIPTFSWSIPSRRRLFSSLSVFALILLMEAYMAMVLTVGKFLWILPAMASSRDALRAKASPFSRNTLSKRSAAGAICRICSSSSSSDRTRKCWSRYMVQNVHLL